MGVLVIQKQLSTPIPQSRCQRSLSLSRSRSLSLSLSPSLPPSLSSLSLSPLIYHTSSLSSSVLLKVSQGLLCSISMSVWICMSLCLSVCLSVCLALSGSVRLCPALSGSVSLCVSLHPSSCWLAVPSPSLSLSLSISVLRSLSLSPSLSQRVSGQACSRSASDRDSHLQRPRSQHEIRIA